MYHLNKIKKTLQPHTVDAFWLQRNLNEIFLDTNDAKIKTEEVFNILKTASDFMI